MVADGHHLAVRRLLPVGATRRGPWLVFLHEGLGSIAQWREVPALLARRLALPALVYDRWGFGGSDPLVLPRPDDFLEREAEIALPAVLAGSGVERPILIGHSDGATIALLYAAAFPERPLALVSEAAHVFLEPVSRAGIRKAEAAWAAGGLRQGLERHHGAKAESVFRGWAETWQRPAFDGWTMLDRLPSIRCPVLALQGADDQYGTPAQLEAIAAGCAGPCETRLLPDCAHSPHHEAREATLKAIEAFLRPLVV
ncbi:alpha/beta fold hydrolase [Tistlia consotensis]|uniref:alpha/beta fold hydrolase n=1 Tax=Tistlia consotensis TaxID=1321365 RepID=UPI001C527C17|nr:alpha/beta fold hydrolase [Tistlia consotensis]